MSDQPKPTGEWTAEALAQCFHEIYESKAPEFGYETRKETRAFDPTTPNGRLMIAVCTEIGKAINAALAAERQRADEAEQGELNEANKLAAERKKVQILEDSVNDFTRSNGALTTEVLQLREQLATITKLEHQLSAAQDALKKILSEIREIASTAIAKDGK